MNWTLKMTDDKMEGRRTEYSSSSAGCQPEQHSSKILRGPVRQYSEAFYATMRLCGVEMVGAHGGADDHGGSFSVSPDKS